MTRHERPIWRAFDLLLLEFRKNNEFSNPHHSPCVEMYSMQRCAIGDALMQSSRRSPTRLRPQKLVSLLPLYARIVKCLPVYVLRSDRQSERPHFRKGNVTQIA